MIVPWTLGSHFAAHVRSVWIGRKANGDALHWVGWLMRFSRAVFGLSRSSLVERFTRYLAEPPMAYLTSWRLRLAADALTSTPKGVADIAAAVGYESEAAFNRASKRSYGAPPARYRRQSRDRASSPGLTLVPKRDSLG